MLSIDDLNAFLWFCYLPRSSSRFLEPILEDINGFKASQARMSRMSESSLSRLGAQTLRNVFNRILESVEGLQIVPLSGGRDSRLILAQLVSSGLADQTIAVTYGTPGTLDYEIAKRVALRLGVRHEVIDLTGIPVTLEGLVDAFESGGDWTNLISSFYNRLVIKMFGSNCQYWYGFLGETLAGGHLRDGYSRMSYSAAKCEFAASNRWAKSEHFPLTTSTFQAEVALPSVPYIADNKIVSFPEQLDLTIRQPSWIMKALITPSVKSHLPYAAADWIRFMLAVPLQRRMNCAAYHSVLYEMSPAAFSIQTKSVRSGYVKPSWRDPFRVLVARLKDTLRHASSRTNPYINYIDFEAAYRVRQDFRALAASALQRLRAGNIVPWLDTGSVIALHESGRCNAARVLDTLISLDVGVQVTERSRSSNDL